VVVPLLDEERTIDELVRRICATLEARRLAFELILIDDGSRDATAARIREVESEDVRVRAFEFTRNFGQAAALACGIFAARGRVVVTLDGDLQNPPEEIPKLLEAIEKGGWVATARRTQRYERTWRWAGSRVAHKIAQLLTGSRSATGGRSRRIAARWSTRCARCGRPASRSSARAVARLSGGVDVTHHPRQRRRTRYTMAALLRISRLVTSFTTVPLVRSARSANLTLGAVGLDLRAAAPAHVAPATALAVFVLGGVWLAAGVLGLYLARVSKWVAGRSAFALRRGPAREESP
jgi:undecaprenyl-phosphate 4-deoxy-4-formamido-L-arabinose transferase